MKISLIKLFSLISIFALVASACGDDSDDAAGEQTAGQVTIAEGTVLDLDNCPDDWDPSDCLLYTSPSPRDLSTSRMPSSA